jgi:hypothetical protein
MNVWFNHITTNTIPLKPFRELWKRTKEKNMFVMQQLIKNCSPPHAHILDPFTTFKNKNSNSTRISRFLKSLIGL